MASNSDAICLIDTAMVGNVKCPDTIMVAINLLKCFLISKKCIQFTFIKLRPVIRTLLYHFHISPFLQFLQVYIFSWTLRSEKDEGIIIEFSGWNSLIFHIYLLPILSDTIVGIFKATSSWIFCYNLTQKGRNLSQNWWYKDFISHSFVHDLCYFLQIIGIYMGVVIHSDHFHEINFVIPVRGTTMCFFGASSLFEFDCKRLVPLWPRPERKFWKAYL